jgi:hypothetical protein
MSPTKMNNCRREIRLTAVFSASCSYLVYGHDQSAWDTPATRQPASHFIPLLLERSCVVALEQSDDTACVDANVSRSTAEPQEKRTIPRHACPFEDCASGRIHRGILPNGVTISGHLFHSRASSLQPGIQISSPCNRSPDLARGRELKQGFSCMRLKLMCTRPLKSLPSHSPVRKNLLLTLTEP